MNIGDYDESDPNGVGYRLMTRDGVKVFDIADHAEYLAERERLRRPVKAPRRPRRPKCISCVALHSPDCIPPAAGLCGAFIREPRPRRKLTSFHYA